jgi:hypothetical protein
MKLRSASSSTAGVPGREVGVRGCRSGENTTDRRDSSSDTGVHVIVAVCIAIRDGEGISATGSRTSSSEFQFAGTLDVNSKGV